MTDKLPSDDLNTTGILEDLFHTLRQYSQAHKVSEGDILRQRARQYAEAIFDQSPPSDNVLTVLFFSVGEERYGIDVGWVRGVRPLPPVTRVPGTPPFYRGVMNVRGTVMTQFDLLAFLGLGQTTDARELVLFAQGGSQWGVPVREVHGIGQIDREHLRDLDDAHYALGIHHDETGGNTVILDANELLNDPRLMGRTS
jgi:chemotaxis signal transduction protein